MSEFLNKLLEDGLTKFGKIQFQTHPPLVRAAHCRHLLSLAKPGMVVCRTYNYFLDAKFIPGEYTHSGIIESADGKDIEHAGTVIHAIAEGVERIDLLDFVKDADGFILLDFNQPYDSDKVIASGRSRIGTPYDFKFSIMDDGKCLYCHEFTSLTLGVGGIKIVPELKAVGPVTREIYTANTLITHPQTVTIYRAQV